jgi:uncharacterized protein YegL
MNTPTPPNARRRRYGPEEMPESIQALLALPVSHFEAMPQQESLLDPHQTEIAFILDRSGSMNRGKRVTIDGYNEQINTIRQGAQAVGALAYTDVQFASEVDLRAVGVALDQAEPLTLENYDPNGSTALMDAIGKTVEALLQRPLIMGTNTAVLVTLFTDGMENASRCYSSESIRALVERLEATQRWTFALVGPQGTIQRLAQDLAVRADNVSGYDVGSDFDKREAFSKVSRGTGQMLDKRRRGDKHFAIFEEDPT